jgi:glycosyltransferase involved in cell wall biosynthesis
VDNVHEYLGASDVFAFPSHFEGLPYSIVEAAASGLAIVASRVGGIPDVIVDGESGVLVAAGDTQALAGTLQRLLADADGRTQLGMGARARALERYSMPAMTARYRALFEALAAKAALPLPTARDAAQEKSGRASVA